MAESVNECRTKDLVFDNLVKADITHFIAYNKVVFLDALLNLSLQENTQELAVVPLLGYSIGYNVVQTILDSSKFEDILRTGLYFNYFPGGILRYYLHI